MKSFHVFRRSNAELLFCCYVPDQFYGVMFDICVSAFDPDIVSIKVEDFVCPVELSQHSKDVVARVSELLKSYNLNCQLQKGNDSFKRLLDKFCSN